MVGSLRVEAAEGERWSLALELLAEGMSVQFQNCWLWPGDDNFFRVGVLSSWHTPTHATAMKDIRHAQGLIEPLLERDEAFAGVVGGRSRRYLLVNNPFGEVTIAELAQGRLEWAPGLRPVGEE